MTPAGLAGPIGFATATFLLVWAILSGILGRSPEQRRIRSLRIFTNVERKADEPWTRRWITAGGLLIDESPGMVRWAARSEAMLERATGAPRPEEWLFLRLTAMVVLAVLFCVPLPVWVALPFGGLLGYHLPKIVLDARLKRRSRRFTDDLPGMLQLMLSSLRSGFTLQQAVEAAVRDDQGPVAEELARALSESRISGEFEDALERVGDRIGSNEIVWLVMALRLQREVGGSLAEVMQTTADTMRERAYLRRHVRTLSAEGRFSGYILSGMPVFTAGVLFLTRPDYVRPLFTEPLGIAMLVGAGVMMLIGVLWMRQAVKVEV
jgi:tight adherence protein B